ncbi:Endoplasmic reticulum chaperone BiP [Mortierella sp. NVP41]|nr:Endoplasmic reticulum chaperone BiP [Mortierella sp. NVP41]
MALSTILLSNPYSCTENPISTSSTSLNGNIDSLNVNPSIADGKFEFFPDENGFILSPSFVSFIVDKNDNGTTQVLFGADAKAQLATNPGNTIFNWQRLIRLSYGDPIVQSEIKRRRVPYRIVSSVPSPSTATCPNFEYPSPHQGDKWNQHSAGLAMIQLTTPDQEQKRLYRPEEITTLLVSHIKEHAEIHLGRNFTHAVVTIPSGYNPDQRWVPQEAISAAELVPLRMTNRHLAPAIAYGLERLVDDERPEEHYDLLVNLDPEYMEIAVVEVDDGFYETLSHVERPGVWFDEALAYRVLDYLVDRHLKRATINKAQEERAQQSVMDGWEDLEQGHRRRRDAILNDPVAMERLHSEVIKANQLFSSRTTPPLPPPQHLVRIQIESFFDGQDFSEELRFSQWQEFRLDTLGNSILSTVEDILKSASVYHIKTALVTGASPLVPDAILFAKGYFGERVDVPQTMDPALAAVHGLTTLARVFGRPQA